MHPLKAQKQGFLEEHFVQAMHGDLTGLKSVPKVDLHVHSTLSTPFSTVKKIAPSVVDPPAHFDDFSHFMDYVSQNYFPVYSNPELVWRLHEACLKSMIEEGIIYSEMSYDLATPSKMGVTWEEHAQMIQKHVSAVKDTITICCELGIKRETTAQELETLIPEALATGLFKSIDLYGDYNSGTVDEFLEIFNQCRKRGIKIKIHSGEFFSSDRIAEDLQVLDVDGIQHGITIIDHPQLIKQYAEKQIPFNVCPTSSVKLAHIDSYENHPIKAMFEAGLNVTIGTDDLSVFDSSLSQEYLALYKSGVFTVDQLEQIRQNGLTVYAQMYEKLHPQES